MTSEEMRIACCRFPDGYAKFRLGLSLHTRHIEVLNSLFSKAPTKVCFRAANSVGKTSSVSLVAILFAIEILNCDVVYTSASNTQISGQLIPKLKALAHLFPGWDFQDRYVKINGIPRLTAFSTRDGIGRMQGFHSTQDKGLLIIVDEGAKVEDDIYQAIGKCFPSYLLVTGSPAGPSGVFYSIETEPTMRKQFSHYKLTQYECLKKDGWWMEEKDIEDYIQIWQSYGWLVPSTVYAEFSSITENGLLTLEELDRCYEFPPKHMGTDMHVGIDVAANGGDFNVLALRIGNKLDIIDVWREPEVMRSCDKIAGHLNSLKEKHGIKPSQVSLDSDGLGIGFISRLKDLDWRINEYHGGAAPDSPEFASNTAEDWLKLVQAIKKCSVIPPNNQEFKLQLLSRQTMKNDKGKLKLESKIDMKSRGIHSPDVADAVAICYSYPSSSSVHFHKQPLLPPKQYSGYF